MRRKLQPAHGHKVVPDTYQLSYIASHKLWLRASFSAHIEISCSAALTTFLGPSPPLKGLVVPGSKSTKYKRERDLVGLAGDQVPQMILSKFKAPSNDCHDY